MTGTLHTSAPILNTRCPYDPLTPKPLPGIAPLDAAHWLQANEAYAAQLAEKSRLLRTRRDDVVWLDPAHLGAAQELLDTVLTMLPEGFARDGESVLCPDGRRVTPDRSDPLGTLGALVQEDLCLMVKDGAEHVLRGAILCFPASWTLAEKAGRPLTGIHTPVRPYDAALAARVQRLFDGIRAGRPLWRFNAFWYHDPALFQPRREAAPRDVTNPAAAGYLRSERQCLLRLPASGAVVFSIHTYVLPRAALTATPA
ncbi:heme-dependent oxidative N-demethylase family protein [Tropicibacter sp. S64]|uniref:heme-dependent oxidative N-demethylase family protein n=1 Tax=Tropicibacter sp. S64 TaxID=3415122 RepID=UPI003C7AE93B